MNTDRRDPATADGWHMRNGVRIWDTSQVRRPNVEMLQRDAPIRVVLLSDYEELLRLFDEAVRLLKAAQDPQAEGNDALPHAIQRILAEVA